MKLKTFIIAKMSLPVLFLFTLLLAGCTGNEDKQIETETAAEEHHAEIVISPEIIEEVGIEVGKPLHTLLRQHFTAQGKVVVNPDYVAHLNSLVTGRVRKIYVQIGDYVKKGDALFEMESLEIANITADYIRAKADFRAEKANYERIKKLRKEDIKAEKDLISAKASYQRAEAELKAAADRKLHSLGFSEEDVESMFSGKEHRRGVLVVKSPINGYVTERNIELGQMIQPDTDIMKVIDNSRIWVEAAVYEKDYLNLKMDQAVSIAATAMPGRRFSGTVIKINKELNPRARTFKVFIEIKKGKTELIPNMFTTVYFQYGAPDSILAVPEEAVQFDGTDYFIFVEDKANSFVRRNVVIGEGSDSLVLIKSGLTAEENVVLRKAFFVKSEMEKESFGGDHH